MLSYINNNATLNMQYVKPYYTNTKHAIIE